MGRCGTSSCPWGGPSRFNQSCQQAVPQKDSKWSPCLLVMNMLCIPCSYHWHFTLTRIIILCSNVKPGLKHPLKLISMRIIIKVRWHSVGVNRNPAILWWSTWILIVLGSAAATIGILGSTQVDVFLSASSCLSLWCKIDTLTVVIVNSKCEPVLDWFVRKFSLRLSHTKLLWSILCWLWAFLFTFKMNIKNINYVQLKKIIWFLEKWRQWPVVSWYKIGGEECFLGLPCGCRGLSIWIILHCLPRP